jgi:enoyl-CoA hydratase
MGAGRTREMIFTSRLVGAEEAQAVGLVTELLADKAALEARALELAGQLAGSGAAHPARHQGGAAPAQCRAAEVDDKDLIALCYTSEDFHEGMEAFLGKRKPDWKGPLR